MSRIRRMRWLLASIVALVVAFFAMLITPLSVSAHHPVVVSSEVTCQQDGSWLITWTADADAVRGYTWWLTAPVNTSATPVPDSSPIQFSTTEPGSATSASATVSARWSNGATGTRTGRTELPTSPCSTTTTTTTTTTSTTSTTTTTLPPETTSTTTTTTLPPETTTTLPPGTCIIGCDTTTTTIPPTTSTTIPPESSTSTSTSTTLPPSTSSSTTSTTVPVIDTCEQFGGCDDPTTTPPPPPTDPTVPPSTHPPTGSAGAAYAGGLGAILLALGGGFFGITKLARRA